MFLILEQIAEEAEIEAYEQTWCRLTELNNYEFQQTLWKHDEKSSKDEMRTQSWKKNEWKHVQEIELTKEKIFENNFINVKVNRMLSLIVKQVVKKKNKKKLKKNEKNKSNTKKIEQSQINNLILKFKSLALNLNILSEQLKQ